MVVVRRISDGLYYNGARANAGFGRGDWVSDLQQILPYTNETGARLALRHHVPYVRCECPRSKGRTPWRKSCQHERERQAEIRRWFDERYEVVPVRLELV